MKKTNRKDVPGDTNSNSTSFKFSVVTSHTLPLNQRISLEGGELKVATCPAFEGNVENIDCRRITHLGRIIENLGSYQAIFPGCMHWHGKWVKHGSICWDNPDREYYEAMDDNALDFFWHHAENTILILLSHPQHRRHSDRRKGTLVRINSSTA